MPDKYKRPRKREESFSESEGDTSTGADSDEELSDAEDPSTDAESDESHAQDPATSDSDEEIPDRGDDSEYEPEPVKRGPPPKKTIYKKRRSKRIKEKVARKEAAADKLTKIKKDRDKLKAKQVEYLARHPAPQGTRGDTSFHLAMVKVGQGDCFIMSTPGGSFVMIDCGSNSKEIPKAEADLYLRTIQDVVGRPKFKGTSAVVDLLLLTHPDKDHYNQVKNVLGDVIIERCYHTNELNKYAAAETDGWLARHCTPPYPKRIANNANGRALAYTIDKAPRVDAIPPVTRTEFTERADASGAVCVLWEPNCKMWILAAEVSLPTEAQGSAKNTGSLVTLIEVYGKRILLCGDATYTTENYLLQTHRARVRGVDVAQAGHHGSYTTSSGQAWVDHVDPKVALFCAGAAIEKHHHPSTTVVNRWLARLEAGQDTVGPHEIQSWSLGPRKWDLDTRFIYRRLYIAGSNTYEYSVLDPARGGGA